MNNKILIGTILVLITLLGVTYSFFSPNISGSGKDNVVVAGSLSLNYEDGPEMTINDAYPGDKIEKIFTVTNTGTLSTSYTIWWKELTNTFINDELVINLECNSYKEVYGEKAPYGSCEGLDEAVIGTDVQIPIKSNIEIGGGIIHEYKLTILFKEMNKLQNYNMNKTFTGTIYIKEYFVNETSFPILENHFFSNNILTFKANDSAGITHYALTYGDEQVATLFNIKPNSIMKMSVNTNDLNWIAIERTEVLLLEVPVENYNVTIHIKNSVGNIFSHDLTPKLVVKVNPNGGSWNGSTGEQTYNMTYNETLEVSNPTREGYTFEKWNIEGEESKVNGTTFTAGIEDTILTANWTINKYTLTVNPNGGKYNDSESNTTYTLDYKSNQTISTPEREGYTFTGWSVSSNKAQLNTNILTIGSENCTLTANWRINNYPWIAYHNKMNVNGSGYTLVSADTKNGEAQYGSKVKPSVNTYTGFTSPSAKEITIVVDSNPPTKNVVNYNYSRNKYGLTINANGGTYSGNNPGEVYYEAEVTILNPSRTGYNFGGWTKTGGGTITDTTFKGGSSASTLTASWNIINYMITYNLNSGTQGSGAKTSYNIETATFSLPIPTRTGYTFAGWYTTSGLTGTAVTQITKGSTGNKTYYAKWIINKVNINYHVNGGIITSTTTENGTVNKWSTTNSFVYLNGSLATQSINNGATDNLWNYNNNEYLNVTRNGYVVPDGAEWICHSGCTIANKTFDHDKTYNASDFCDTSSGDCTVVVKVNWKSSTLYGRILEDNPTIKNDSTNLFANVADEASESGLFRTTDLSKTEGSKEVLYFRGVVENNYLVFANYCWRIVRTNESGVSIKLRYGGEPTVSGGSYICPQTGTDVKINNTTYTFNNSYNNTNYVQYVYGTSTNSKTKTEIESWYTSKIESQGVAVTNLIIDEPYCNDTSYTLNGSTYCYGAYTRLRTNKNPQYKCPKTSDKYTVSSTKGNGKLSKPVALLTADEAAYAGGVFGASNTTYYLYTGSNYWLMSPSDYLNSIAYVFHVDGGALYGSNVNGFDALFPSISVSNVATITASGTGTYNNPYVIVTE